MAAAVDAWKCRSLLIDHYDSFSHNLAQQLHRVLGVAPLILHCDAPWSQVKALLTQVRGFDLCACGLAKLSGEVFAAGKKIGVSDLPLRIARFSVPRCLRMGVS